MSPKKMIAIIVPSIAIIVLLFFIPTNEFFGNSLDNEESPSPMMILESDDDVMMGFTITPGSCNEVPSGLTESQFQISNSNEKDYEITLGISFADNESILSEKQITVKVLSGQTINQTHLSDDIYDNPICVVKIIDWSEI